MQLYPQQQQLKTDIYDAWNDGNRNVLAQLPTGGGKTVTFASIIHDHNGTSAAIAHRSELVGQISLALATEQVKHRIIAPKETIKFIVQDQIRELGRSWFDPNALCGVVSVNTLVARKDKLQHWTQQVTRWIQDEGHHVLRENMWGEAISLFPNAYGVGFTATPGRADGKGLGRKAQGVYDVLVQGPGMRWHIDHGYLCEYRVICADSHIDLSDVNIGSTGDYIQPQLKKAVRRSPIIGDVVEAYLRWVPGKLGVVFATDVETATDIARKFNERGIRAEVVHSKTDDSIRTEIIRRFRRGEIKVLVNVDLFGEGFNLPAIEFVSMARPTASYNLYVQQFGRALRTMLGKTHGVIIDHVGNVAGPRGHGLPDRPHAWTLENTPRASKEKTDAEKELQLRVCIGCSQPYERYLKACPYEGCGKVWVPSQRSAPEFVDGDLFELDEEVLKKMRGAVSTIDGSGNSTALWMKDKGHPHYVVDSYLKNHRERQYAQQALRESISWWAGWQKKMGRPDDESYRRFYLTFDVDIMTAQTLGRPDALKLADRINQYIGAVYRDA